MNSSDSFPEQLTADALARRQNGGLCELVQRVAQHNPYWQHKFAKAKVDVDSFDGLADLHRLPFTTKSELVDDQDAHPPYGTNLTFPLRDYVRLHQTSGTTGRPMRWLDTSESWAWFLRCWEQIYRIVEIQPDDVLGFPFSFGPFIGFWAAFDAAQKFGNRVLSLGGMSSEARLRMIFDLGATVLCCTPTYALRLVEVAESMKLSLSSSPVRMLIVAGEPGGAIPAIRQRLETAWGARIIDHWGMTEIGPLGIEPIHNPGGLLILESECLAEIIDPESMQPVSPGNLGELVLTNLGRTGQPLIRYRTGDLVRAATVPCASGYPFLRLEGGILGRYDDMVTIRGNNLFPSSLDAVLREFSDVVEYRTTVVTRRSMPHVKIEIEPTESVAACVESRQALTTAVSRAVKDRLNFQAEVQVVPVNALPRFELKGRRFHRDAES